MRFGSIFLASSVFAVSLVGQSGNAIAAKTCGDFLATVVHTYSCTITPSGGTPFHDCLEAEGGTGGFLFQFVVLDGGIGGVCACDATGTSKAPKLDAARNAFTCVGSAGSNHDGLSGKVTAGGAKILGGNFASDTPDNGAFSCEEVPLCTP